jgi:uncharacterized protein (TIGR03435 family)
MKQALLLIAALPAFAANRPAFEVASVKLFHDDGVSPRNSRTWTPQGVTFGGCSLGFIIAEAYGIPPGAMIGPRSLTKETLWPALQTGYDIAGKSDHPVSKDEIRLMLQSLLAERFKLTLHHETKTGPAYKLAVAKGGPKLEESQDPLGSFVFERSPEGYLFRNAEPMRLSGYLSSQLDRVTVDETGLKGLYNFTLKLPEDVVQNPDMKIAGTSPESPAASRFAEALAGVY